MHLALIVQVAIGHTVAKFIFFYAQFGKKKGKKWIVEMKNVTVVKDFFFFWILHFSWFCRSVQLWLRSSTQI